MVNLSDIKPLFYAARFFGCAPHLVTDTDILLTTSGLVYSGLWALGFVCCCSYGLILICSEVHNGERNIVALTAVRTILAYVCFFADDALTMRWNERLRSALLQLRNFDVTISYGQTHPTNWKLKCCCWLVVGTIIAYWVGVGYVTYKCELTNPLFNAITYVIANAAISMQLIKFSALLLLLRQRFRYLRKLLLSEVFVPSNLNSAHRPVQLQDVWWLHCSLANAAETINSCYSMQLILWIFTMWLNALSRIYAMIETFLDDEQFLLKLRESLLVTACIGNLILIAVACHLTAQEANSIGKAVFVPQTTLSRKRCSIFEHSIEVGMYFSLRQLHFSAAGGFIQVDLPLLLSIAGAMTTYLVVLHNNS